MFVLGVLIITAILFIVERYLSTKQKSKPKIASASFKAAPRRK